MGKIPKKEVVKLEKQSLKYSVYEGSSASIMEGSGTAYISPFAMALNASNTEVAFLSSIPSLFSPLTQLITVHFLKKIKSRKTITISFVLLQALIWIPIMLLPFMNLSHKPIFLIALFTLLSAFGSFISPIWASWISDMVDPNKRGNYFGRRNAIAGSFAIAFTFMAAYILDALTNKLFIAFAIIFIIAMIGRLLSSYFLTKQFEPEFKFPEQDYFSFKSFLKKMPETNFGKFSMYQSFLNFAVMIASPFFAVYMIRNLNFSYPQYTLITVTASIFSLIGMRVWGKYADKHGNVKTLKILGIFIAIVPLLWIFNSNIYYLLFVQVISGFAWGGFNLSVSDFIYDATTKEKRALFISYHNVLNGIASFLGAALGGILVAIKMPFTPIILLFVLSGILRIIFYYIFIHKIEEPRNIKEVHHTHRLINLAPSQGLLHELIAIVSKRKNNKQ
ncbi:MFS transporter [Candidatus Woesearchaeota archaeon]|nr:MFS transporter [Candidatus Woesearchaeota archaeon]